MIARGQKFVALSGVHYTSYQGVTEALSPFRNISMFGEEDESPLHNTPVRTSTRNDLLSLTLSRLKAV